MPSKLRRAIGAVKDQTSLSLALVSGSSDIQVAVLRATSHEESPVEEERLTEVLLLASSSPESAADAIRALARRLSRTSNWVVAVKSLCLVSRAISDAGPNFRSEALAASNFGDDGQRRLLDLSGFRDESGLSSPWDFTAFARTLALYLDARLEASAAGKLLPRARRCLVSNMKPPVLLDRIGHWRRLLDRAMGTRPTGPARAHRLVRAAFYSVVRESFDLYRDTAEGLTLLLDSFFHLSNGLCQETFRATASAAKLFEELDAFYAGCKKMGIGRHSEYPGIRKISDSLLETLEEFLKDGRAAKIRSPPKLLPTPATSNSGGEDSPQHESESWELVLLESMNELSNKTHQMNESPRKKQDFPSSFQNPFLRAANDKSLMAVTPSPSSSRAKAEKGEAHRRQTASTLGESWWVVAASANDRSLMTSTPAVYRDYREQIRERLREEEEKEEDPFEQLARRRRPPLMMLGATEECPLEQLGRRARLPLMSQAAKEFCEQYYRRAS